MARISTLFAAAVLFCAPCPAGTAAERPTLVVGFSEFPPSIYTDEQGHAQGRLADITRQVLQQAGYQASFRSLPNARLFAALKNGSVSLWAGAAGKPELAAHTLESRHSVAEINLHLYHRPDTPAPNLPEDLTGQGVIMIAGYDYWPNINRILDDPKYRIRLHRTASHLSGLRMLEHHRANFLLGYQRPVEHARQQLGIAPLPSVLIKRVPIRFIISRYVPESEALRDALDRAYEQLLVAIPGWPREPRARPTTVSH